MFKAVFIPADATAIIEERILDASGGLENDRLRFYYSCLLLIVKI